MACRQTEASNAGSNDVGQEDPERINVMFLCDEWKSSKGGLSTFNREFAVNLAKSASDRIKVHCYVSQSDKLGTEDARQHGVNLITAQIIPGSTDPLDWLKTPPPELPNPDIVIGHGRKLGIPAFFIARLRDAKSKWVHFVHVFCEDLGKYKVTQSASLDSIEENEKKHKKEIELCKAADVVVAVGSRLQQKYSRSLPSIKVEVITPGIIEKFYTESSQLVKDRSVVKKFNVFMFGRSTFEDRTLKGYDIIANAIGSLGKMFELTFVGSSPGEHRKIEQWFLDSTDISRNQLTIRSYCNEQDELKMMFHESDVVVLPSRTEGFGLVALEAISAGIPVLVAGESGIAEALEQVEGGNSVTVESDDARDWAQRIQQLSNQSPEDRDNNAKLLRENYSKTYSWSNECERFKKMIQDLVESLTCNALKLRIDVETMKPAEHNTQDRTPFSRGSQNGGHQETSAARNEPVTSEFKVLSSIASNYLLTTPPRNEEERSAFLNYMKEMRVIITDVRTGSLLITVKCNSLQILERLWKDYSSGHLSKVVQRCFATKEILTELSLAELKLKTTISEEEYKACKVYFAKEPATDQCESVAVLEEKPGHFTDEKISKQTDDLQTQTDYGKLKTETDEDDSVPLDEEGNPRSNRQDQKEQWTRKQWEGKKGGSKAPFHDREKAGQDDNFNKHKRQPHKGRRRVVSRERQVGSSKGKGKASDKNKDQRPGRQYPKPKTQHHARQVFHGKCISLELKTLKEMDTTEVVDALNESIPRLKFFLQSQEEEHNSNEFIFDLTCTLAIACNAPPSESTNKILAALKGSLFLSAKIPHLLDRLQASTALNDPDSQRRLIQWLIKVFTRYLRHLPSSYADLPYDQLKRVLEQSNIDGKDEVQKELEAFKQARDDIIIAERQKHGKRYINKAGQKPPNDFRDIPICPTNKEITSQDRPFLRKNISKGRYEDAEHYLDVQFRLLREDFLEPLREGIHEIVNNVPGRQRNQLMKYYPGARIVDKKFTPSGIIYEVQFDISRFDTRKWAHSKRLMFGSFLSLSKDNFETMLFATVANRDPDELKIGKIDIRFIEEQDVFGIENRKCEYQMVESPAYYEAYRHVLKGLKELDETSMPFKKYLVECSEDVDPPEYLWREDSEEPVCYDLSLALDVQDATNASRVPVLQLEAWPSVETLPLNSSQLEALKTAVTTEFSVIQGPPGTGKTYVGAKIVRCLLANREAWDPDGISPMLMVCYTNHALDKFLEKVLEFLPKQQIIRVGGRCKSQQLERCNLKLFTGRYRMHERRREIRDMIDNKVWEMEGWKELLAKADTVLLEFDDLEELLNSQHTEQLYTAIFPTNAETEFRTPGTTFKLWLCSNKQMDSCNQRPAKAKREDQAGKRQDGSIPPGSAEGGGDEVFYDASLLTAPGEANEGKGENFLAPTNENWEAAFPENFFPKEALSLSNPLSEENASNLATKTHPESKKYEMMETPLDTTVPKGLSGQQSSEREASVVSQTNPRVEHGAVCKTLGELEEVENVTEFMAESDIVNENSHEGTVEAFEETITIEKEADLIQYQRCIHGDEDFLPVMSKQSDDLSSQKQDEEETIKDQEEGWQTVTYRKKGKTFPWQQKSDENTNDGKESAQVEPDQDNTAQTKSSKKNKRKNKKIKIAADINSLKPDLEKETTMTTDETMRVDNIWLLSPSDRLRLYLFWVESYRERYRVEIQRSEQEYEQLCHELETVRFEEEQEVICRATVVGMTTSGAARYHSVLQKIAPRVVVIEEAAEVMEADIITSLAKDTKHTILIGDHKQLRPKATVYELAQKYNLEISLFERMVMNNMDCKRLCIQHRMRPEIAALTKRIYDHEIVDHESVCEFEDIVGVKHNLFFIDHCKPEILVGGLQSYSNPHEADFLVSFCSYLLLQGYSQSQITILTMYTGQLLLLQEKMPRRTFGGVRVCAVDNFQGEENDIILLSLVRSNSEHRIGFLSESNRICVALSRARQGFYCIGNFSLLKSQCKLWKEICDYLQTKNAIGEILQLVCKKHKNVTNVRCSSDFDRSGGCKKPCGDRRDCGHLCQDYCCNDCEARPCKELVARTLPCGHATTLPCHINTETYKCNKRIEVRLSCGHEKSLVCHVAKAGKENVICNEKVEKELRCKHVVTLSCHKNPEEYDCKEKVRVKLACGHTKSLICSTVTADLQGVSCMVNMKQKLPCGHEVTLPCCKNPEEYCCQEEVEVILSCGHKKLVACSRARDALQGETCDTKVYRKLPCGHEKEMKCSDQPGELFCDAPCERLLACKHPCPEKCGTDCASLKCVVTVEKELACGYHKVTCACSDDMSQNICENKCERNLSCGHKCPGKCHENCSLYKCRKIVFKRLDCAGKHSFKMPCSDDPRMVTCQELCDKNLGCGHPCPGLCSQDCGSMRCMRRVEKRFPCGHKEPVHCFQSSTATCTAPCRRRKTSCKHICKGVCGQDCSFYPCDVAVVKTLLCGHRIKMPCSRSVDDVQCPAACEVKLPCGHQCSGTCDDCHQRGSHELCQHPCGRLLVCSHRCNAICSEPCPPCDRQCGRRCPHGKCQKRCSQSCKPCKQPCNWSCPHYQCNNLCGEECDRPRCNAPCPKQLPCRHPCIGLCGENCPTVCGVCHRKKFSSMLADARGSKTAPTRYLQLFDCGHIIRVEEMDAWMLRELGSDVQLMLCPRCSTPIRFSYRYGNLVKRTLANIEDVKKQIEEIVNEAAYLVSDNVGHVLLQMAKFPQDLLNVFMEPWRPNSLHLVHLRQVPLIFTLKNHLLIMHQVEKANHLLQTITRDQAVSIQQLEIKEYSSTSKQALKNIREYLEKPQLDLKTLNQVREHTKWIFLFSLILEAQSQAIKHHKSFSSVGESRLQLARTKFNSFLQGDNEALELEWLERIANLLRKEVNLPSLFPEEPMDLENFPGFSRGVWKCCGQRHVFCIRFIVRDGEDVTLGTEGCNRCAIVEEYDEEM